MRFIAEHRRLVIIAALVLAIPALAFVWWLFSPLLIDDEVNEELPDDVVFVTATPVDMLVDSDAMATAFPMANNAVIEPGDTYTDAEATMVAAATADSVVMDEDMPVAASDEVTAIEIKRGQFRDADSFHQGSGDAILFQLSDGRYLLRFENFEVTNGPDLRVYVVPRANRDAVDISGYVDLGELKGNVGSQNYFIDADVGIGAETSIVIWCEPFQVLFSTASLDNS